MITQEISLDWLHFTLKLFLFRDEYVGELRNFKRSRDLENLTQNKNYSNRKRDPKLLKFAYEVHATPTISLDFVQPSLRAKFVRV